MEIISGHDPSDATSAPREVPSWTAACDTSIKGLRVGVPEEYFAEGIDRAVAARVRAAIG